MVVQIGHEVRHAEGAGLAPRLAGLVRRAMDLVLPPRCPSCLATVSAPGGLCGPCWSRVDFISPPYCVRLGTPFPYDPGGAVESPAAIAHPPAYGRARAVARYDGPARALVHAVKFRDRLEIADQLAGWMARAGGELIADCDLILPVPLHRRRLLARRFNQSALLAERIAQRAGRPYAPFALERVKPTRQQIGLTARERRANLSGAVRVASDWRAAVDGRHVLVVDDVLTTGATADACARACLAAGARAADMLVFARVVTAP